MTKNDNPSNCKAEFDAHAEGYAGGMEDPLKQVFGRALDDFIEPKIDLVMKELDGYCAGNLTPRSGIKLLDFGCGAGALLIALQRRGFEGRLEGCDLSQNMLDELARRWKTGAPPQLHALKEMPLPFSAGSFDIITGSCVLHHIPPAKRNAVYNELLRILKPGGRLLLFEHNPLNPLTRLIVSRARIDRNAVLLGAKEIGRALNNAGFVNIRITYYLFFPPRFGGALLRAAERFLSRIPIGGQYMASAEKPL
jgi:SAM-dependent methyltransferase